MFEQGTLIVFLLGSVLLLITPGPAVVYIVARSVGQGTPAGLVAAAGMHVGTLVHVAAAAYGVSQLIATSTLAFSVIRYLGAAYLIVLGVRSFLSAAALTDGAPPRETASLTAVFRESILVNVLNPKTALFFFAFLPQFASPEADASMAAQITVLGLIFVALGLVSDGLYAIFAGAVGDRLRRSGGRVGNYVAGTVFMGLGLITALARK